MEMKLVMAKDRRGMIELKYVDKWRGDTDEEMRNFTIWLDSLYQDLTSNS